ncbi:Postreplication repair E3 ubiquitin-protein ligase rad18 [Golovinomyces cichoracearum]|uniref:Postreplication repair E3 ubiquitin-protein ligase RAD18 n=1 Tax=Golovinomyces cichoracearum TaxID=62708 RepID=A0A420HMZ8_9PEZI|nr:Postreplication repair E3 ubiquitin-protein ligase rad18 [Golovinomyces cichoracearum]
MQGKKFDEAFSTDWLDTPLRSLSRVDSALRCQVCKDFYSTPMITSCAHTFCSLCIRRCLSNDGRCPTCRGPEQELRLRNNGAIEELVEAFKDARAEVLEFAREQTHAVPIPDSPSKRSLDERGINGDDNSPKKRTRYSRRLGNAKANVVIPDSDSDDENDHQIPGNFVFNPIYFCLIIETLDRSLIRCPICNLQMKESRVNAHLDRNCQEEISGLTGSFNQRMTKNIMVAPPISFGKPIKRPERLPQINFSMFKDTQLRKKLGEHGLAQGGSRLAMQKRYAEWITLWNSNCDATRPKPPNELRGELERWERIQEGRGPGANSLSEHVLKIKDKDFDGKAWSSTHVDSFRGLIEKARHNFENPPTLKLSEAESDHPAGTRTEAVENSDEILIMNQPLALQEDKVIEKSYLSKQPSSQEQSRYFKETAGTLNVNNVSVLKENCSIIADSRSSGSKLS